MSVGSDIEVLISSGGLLSEWYVQPGGASAHLRGEPPADLPALRTGLVAE